MVMVMPPYHGATIRVPEPGIYEFFRAGVGRDQHPDHDPGCAGRRHAAVGRLSRAHGAARSSNVSYFKIEMAGAAASCAS